MRGFRRDLDNAAGLAQGHVVNAGSGGGGPGGLRGWKRQENNDDGEEGIPDVEGNFPPGRGWIKRDGSNDESPTSSSITGVEGNWGLRGFIKRDDSQETVAPTGTQGVEGNWGLRGFVKKMKKRQEGGDGDDDEGEGDETGEGAGNGVEQNWVPPRGWAK